jgi:hypothetical protein
MMTKFAPPQRERDVGQRAGGDQRDLAGRRHHRVDDVVRGVARPGHRDGRRQLGAEQAVRAVHGLGRQFGRQQRGRAACGHRDVVGTGELAHPDRVRGRLGQADIAGHGGDADQVDLRAADRVSDGESVIDARIAIQNDLLRH